jgi:hypothetical protein
MSNVPSVHAAELRSVFKGKQLVVSGPKQPAAAQEGLFGKLEYKSHVFDDSLGYLKTTPLDARKRGFGSRLPNVRDEFTKHIRTEQYRETVKVSAAWLASGQ